MGYRLHCATKYEAKYSTGDAFNYKCEEFHNLLMVCGADYTGESWDSEFEVTREEWVKAIDKLKALNTLDENERNEIMEAVNEMEYEVNDIISSMEYFLEQADPNNDYLHLCYF
jgi:hypothetical protein